MVQRRIEVQGLVVPAYGWVDGPVPSRSQLVADERVMIIGFRGKVPAKRGLRIGPPQREVVRSLVEDEERSTVGIQLSEQAEHEQCRQEYQTGKAAVVLAKDPPLATCLVTHAQGERHGYLGALSKLM